MSPKLERRERANGDVVSVRIPERELLCSSIRIRVWLLFEPVDESACPFQGHIEIVDAEKQEEPVAGSRIVRARQRRMLVRAPLVEAEQDSSIRIEDLTKVRMGWLCLGLAEERLVPFETGRHIAYSDDRPSAFHDIFLVGLTFTRFVCPNQNKYINIETIREGCMGLRTQWWIDAAAVGSHASETRSLHVSCMPLLGLCHLGSTRLRALLFMQQ